MKRFCDTLNLCIIVWIVGFALWVYPSLPPKIPLHFGADGIPDSWGPRSVGSWFTLPGIALAMTLGMGWLRWMIPRRPNWVNLPDRTRLTDLPEVARGPVLDMVSGFLALVQTELLAIFSLIEWGSYLSATGGDSQGIMITVLILALVASPFFMVVFFLRFQGAMEEGKRRAARAGVAVR